MAKAPSAIQSPDDFLDELKVGTIVRSPSVAPVCVATSSTGTRWVPAAGLRRCWLIQPSHEQEAGQLAGAK